jgi:hypothetical protein
LSSAFGQNFVKVPLDTLMNVSVGFLQHMAGREAGTPDPESKLGESFRGIDSSSPPAVMPSEPPAG